MSFAVELAFPGRDAGAVNGGGDFEAALGALSDHRQWRGPALDFDTRVATLAGLSREILRRDSSLRRALPGEGLAFLGTFLQESTLRDLVTRELADPGMLSRFVAVSPRKRMRLVPRGLVGHWIAGNVPLLAVFSWVLSAALGNRNVVRLSSRQVDVMSPLLEALQSSGEAGRQIAAETLVVAFDREDHEAHALMSRACDVRIAWGGAEAVEAVRALPAKWECEDVVFGPRMSFAVVDPELMDDAATRRLATDICVFDQLACSSPQVVFVRGEPESDRVGAFAEALGAAMQRVAAAYPRHPLDYSETFRIELDRARAVLDGGRVRRDAATQWTVAVTERPNDQLDCANRFVQVTPAPDLETILGYIPDNVQTVVTALADDELEQFSERAAHLGVCRMPAPGEGNNFENPWDGVGLVSRLTRYVTHTQRGTKQE